VIEVRMRHVSGLLRANLQERASRAMVLDTSQPVFPGARGIGAVARGHRNAKAVVVSEARSWRLVEGNGASPTVESVLGTNADASFILGRLGTNPSSRPLWVTQISASYPLAFSGLQAPSRQPIGFVGLY
jgi:hypothetical protein